jgi:hypothetical protein
MNGTIKSIQLFLGILTGLLGLSAIAGGVGYYLFITQISTHPPKPVFAEEREGSKTAVSTKSPSPLPNEIQKLAPEAYNVKVTGQNGLSLQKAADPNAEKISSLAANDKVAIVKTSDDGQWVLVQPEKDNIQGWLKANNVEKIDGTNIAKEKEPAKEASAPQSPTRTRRAAASDEEQPQPRRRRRRVKAEPQQQADDNSNDEQAQPRRRRKAVVEEQPQADDNNDEQPQPKRRRKTTVAPEPSADEQESDN